MRGTSAICGSGASWASDMVAVKVNNVKIRFANRIDTPENRLAGMNGLSRLVKYQKMA